VLRTEPMTATRPAISVDGLTKRFGDRAAVVGLTFEVAEGEIFGLLGPNGAGKTTTVRLLSTLLAPTSGTAEVAGVPIGPEASPEIRRRIGVLPETPGLYLRLTVRDNLEFFAGLYGLSAPEARRRIGSALAQVGLADRAGDRAGSLSKGLRQRAALARALLPDPAVLFLDEPTTGLDPVAAAEVRELVASLRDRGTTVVLTTHRLDEAERLCDRVAILNTRLVSVGRPEELRAQLFRPALEVRLERALADPASVFGTIPGVRSWTNGQGAGRYVLEVEDPDAAAPDVARTLVGIGASILRLGDVRRSLEDAYLELVDDER
jgi:ABC-2 type transport system ATP-binding protein